MNVVLTPHPRDAVGTQVLELLVVSTVPEPQLPEMLCLPRMHVLSS